MLAVANELLSLLDKIFSSPSEVKEKKNRKFWAILTGKGWRVHDVQIFAGEGD